MPVGLRLARAQVRNYEIRLVKSRAVLSAQEQEIAYELNTSLRNMERWYALSESSTKRLQSATFAMESSDDRMEKDIKLGDPVAVLSRNLEAKTSLRDAEQAWLRSLVEYNKAIVDMNFRKGMSLRNQSIFLSEGEWNPAAYEDARKRAEATTNAIDNPYLRTEPLEIGGPPAPNAWESVNPTDRPHVTGTPVNPGLSGDANSSAGPSTDVPLSPQTESQDHQGQKDSSGVNDAPDSDSSGASDQSGKDFTEPPRNAPRRDLNIPNANDPVTSSGKKSGGRRAAGVSSGERGQIRKASDTKVSEPSSGSAPQQPGKPRVPSSKPPEKKPWSLFGPDLSRDFSQVKPTPRSEAPVPKTPDSEKSRTK
jgi:hypothetical protein